jgi:hypothetical protein
VIGQLLAMAGIVSAYWVEENHTPNFTRWIDPMQRLIGAVRQWPSASTELAVRTAFLAAASFTLTDHPLAVNTARLLELMERGNADANHRAAAGVVLMPYFVSAGELAQAGRVAQQFEQLFGHAELSPLNLAMGLAFIGF